MPVSVFLDPGFMLSLVALGAVGVMSLILLLSPFFKGFDLKVPHYGSLASAGIATMALVMIMFSLLGITLYWFSSIPALLMGVAAVVAARTKSNKIRWIYTGLSLSSFMLTGTLSFIVELTLRLAAL
ncbi:hypothetical protein ACFLZP_02455 [Patescibacteria group bacterium]